MISVIFFFYKNKIILNSNDTTKKLINIYVYFIRYFYIGLKGTKY